DVLHSHFFWSDALGALVAAATGVRVISTRHETGSWMRGPHKRLERLVYRRFERILCVSEAVRRSLVERGVPEAKLAVVPPGVGAETTPVAAGPGPRRVLSVGRLERVKGHDVLIDAFARVAARVPAVELVIVGDGAERAALERRVVELGLGERVRFRGAVE